MKRVIVFILLVAVAAAVWFFFFRTSSSPSGKSKEKLQSAAVGNHSDSLNRQLNQVIDAYLSMKEALVNWDSAAAKQGASRLMEATTLLKLDEIKSKDSSIYLAAQQNLSDIEANLSAVSQDNSLTEIRHDFSMVSENLYPLLKTIGYEGEKLYWQNCPMAFGEDKPANWLSKTSGIVNPYLGNKHPEYKSAMLNCGENVDSLYHK